LMLEDMTDMRPSVLVHGICELWESPSCQLSSADLITASLLWLCIMLGWSDHCLPIMGGQQAAVLPLSLLVPHPIFQMSFDKSTHHVILFATSTILH
jgi:hypothetical protein